ncbi:MAG TPA: GtrA family protein [Micromonosporaceae bacterium]
MATTNDARRGDLLARLLDRFGDLLAELGKFGAVGLGAYVVDVTVFNLCRFVVPATRGEWLPSLVVSTAIAATVAFVGNRWWTWRDRERSSLRREYGLYFFFNAVGLAINAACLWTSHELLGHVWPVFATGLADNISKNVVGMAFATLFRFWAYRRFVFPPTVPAEVPAETVSAAD